MMSSSKPQFCFTDSGNFMEGFNSQCSVACFCGAKLFVGFFFYYAEFNCCLACKQQGANKCRAIKVSRTRHFTILSYTFIYHTRIPSKISMHSSTSHGSGTYKDYKKSPYFCSHLSSLSLSFFYLSLKQLALKINKTFSSQQLTARS